MNWIQWNWRWHINEWMTTESSEIPNLYLSSWVSQGTSVPHDTGKNKIADSFLPTMETVYKTNISAIYLGSEMVMNCVCSCFQPCQFLSSYDFLMEEALLISKLLVPFYTSDVNGKFPLTSLVPGIHHSVLFNQVIYIVKIRWIFKRILVI